MAIVAQSVEHRVVILDVAGSSPVGRPFLFGSETHLILLKNSAAFTANIRIPYFLGISAVQAMVL